MHLFPSSSSEVSAHHKGSRNDSICGEFSIESVRGNRDRAAFLSWAKTTSRCSVGGGDEGIKLNGAPSVGKRSLACPARRLGMGNRSIGRARSGGRGGHFQPAGSCLCDCNSAATLSSISGHLFLSAGPAAILYSSAISSIADLGLAFS